ncbi:hypothetical protein COP2_009928 [Malus domestica]
MEVQAEFMETAMAGSTSLSTPEDPVGNNFRWSRNCLRHFSNKGIFGAFLTQYLGLFNNTNNGNEANHVFAIELDSIQNIKLGDINNHVRIDINGLHSKKLAPAGYYAQNNGGSET